MKTGVHVMPGSFDPYHKWLGIPPHDQPANHYRLLGLDLFEDDGEVIKLAVDRQTGRVERLQSDEHARSAAMLLEQLAEARRCLLDAEKKRLYDEGLRDGQKAEWKRRRPAAVGLAPVADDRRTTAGSMKPTATTAKRETRSFETPIVRPVTPTTRSARSANRPTSRQRAQRNPWKIAALVGGVSAGLFVAGFAILARKPPDAQLKTQTASSRLDPDQAASEREAAVILTGVPQSEESAEPPPKTTALDEPVTLHHHVRQGESPDTTLPETTLPETTLPETTLPETTVQEMTEPIAGDEERGVNEDSLEPFPYAGMILWLDAADEERIEVGEDRRVQVWYDGSDAEHHATPSEESTRPLFVALPNRLAVVRFSAAQALTIADAAAFNVSDDYSITVVARGDTGVLLDKGDGYNEGAFSFWNGVTSVRTHKRTLRSGEAASDKLQVHSLIADELQVRWHIDGTLRREITGPHTIDNQAPLLIGCRGKEEDPRYFVGDIAELLIYDRALSGGELRAVEAYLLDKWSPVSGAELAMATDVAEPEGTEPLPDAVQPDPNIADSDDSLPAPRGAILREVWRDVPGSSVEDFVAHVAEHPDADEREEIERLEPPEDFADHYGQRLRGYLHPPATGEYQFSLRANAGGLIYVSPDMQPANKRLTEPGKPIQLQTDAAYYIEVFHKESTGRDYLSVGWTLPDGVEESPIPGERLSVEYRIAPPHQTQFVPLRLVSAEASAGSQLTADEDGRIVVTAASKQAESYHLSFQPSMKRITALRLEALPHEDLPAGGPGLGAGGRFAIDEAAVYVIRAAESSPRQRVEFQKMTADNGADLMRLASGKEATPWKVSGRGDQASATFFPAMPISTAGATLLVEIKNRELLGSFRITATSAPQPGRLKPGPAGFADEAFALHVNLGGQTHTAPDGTVWKESKHFDNKTFGHEGGRSVVADEAQNPVQGSALRGIQAFRAMVPAGRYEVTLYFCEYWSSQSTARTFSIAAEQRVVARNMSLLQASGGIGRPLAYPVRNVTVNDGRLDIEFQPSQPQASAILNAIRVKQVSR